MAPKVIAPMDFGKHLIGSPTHSNLKLKTNKGREVLASSVILSYNSPVIDRMTTSLHRTSVDMLDFGEAAVRLFVDAAYSGNAEGLTRDTFRDLNSIASMFEVTWLADKCAEFFTEVADSMKAPNYVNLVYLFEEAGFVFEKLKIKDYLHIAFRKIETLKWKQQFIDKYLENADRLSTKQLDMVIELAGNEGNYVVKTITGQLTELLKIKGKRLPLSHEYLLENANLYRCKDTDLELYERLFDGLRELPDDKMRWTLDLLRKSTVKPTSKPELTVKVRRKSSKSSKSVTFNETVDHLGRVPRCNTITNLYHNLDTQMTFEQLMSFISVNEKVTNVLMAVEAVWTWNRYRQTHGYKNTEFSIGISTFFLCSRLAEIAEKRGWPLLPQLFGFFSLFLYSSESNMHKFRLDKLCVANGITDFRYMVIHSVGTCTKPLSLLSKEAKLTFHFKHPSVTSCHLPGKCGFILKTVPSESALLKLELCSEKEQYQNESVHYHDVVRAERMHVFFRLENYGIVYLLPMSWLGWLQSGNSKKRNEWENIYGITNTSRFAVLYEFDYEFSSQDTMLKN